MNKTKNKSTIISIISIIISVFFIAFLIYACSIKEDKIALLEYPNNTLLEVQYEDNRLLNQTAYGFVDDEEFKTVLDDDQNGFLEIKHPFINNESVFIKKSQILSLTKTNYETVLNVYKNNMKY